MTHGPDSPADGDYLFNYGHGLENEVPLTGQLFLAQVLLTACIGAK